MERWRVRRECRCYWAVWGHFGSLGAVSTQAPASAVRQPIAGARSASVGPRSGQRGIDHGRPLRCARGTEIGLLACEGTTFACDRSQCQEKGCVSQRALILKIQLDHRISLRQTSFGCFIRTTHRTVSREVHFHGPGRSSPCRLWGSPGSHAVGRSSAPMRRPQETHRRHLPETCK